MEFHITMMSKEAEQYFSQWHPWFTWLKSNRIKGTCANFLINRNYLKTVIIFLRSNNIEDALKTTEAILEHEMIHAIILNFYNQKVSRQFDNIHGWTGKGNIEFRLDKSATKRLYGE